MSARRHPLDVDARALHRIAMLLAGGLVAIVVLMYAVWRLALQPAPTSAPTAVPPPPRLEGVPHDTLSARDATEPTALDRYRWVDEAHGIAEIPVDRAMQILAAQATEPTPHAPKEPSP